MVKVRGERAFEQGGSFEFSGRTGEGDKSPETPKHSLRIFHFTKDEQCRNETRARRVEVSFVEVEAAKIVIRPGSTKRVGGPELTAFRQARSRQLEVSEREI
jgi:hypothetical protein